MLRCPLAVPGMAALCWIGLKARCSRCYSSFPSFLSTVDPELLVGAGAGAAAPGPEQPPGLRASSSASSKVGAHSTRCRLERLRSKSMHPLGTRERERREALGHAGRAVHPAGPCRGPGCPAPTREAAALLEAGGQGVPAAGRGCCVP